MPQRQPEASGLVKLCPLIQVGAYSCLRRFWFQIIVWNYSNFNWVVCQFESNLWLTDFNSFNNLAMAKSYSCCKPYLSSRRNLSHICILGVWVLNSSLLCIFGAIDHHIALVLSWIEETLGGIFWWNFRVAGGFGVLGRCKHLFPLMTQPGISLGFWGVGASGHCIYILLDSIYWK